MDRGEFLAGRPDAEYWRTLCKPPSILETGFEHGDAPYLADGTTYNEIEPSCNWPSAYYAQLNRPRFFSFAQKVYAAVEHERLRRFRQWTRERTVEETGAYQYNMFIDFDMLAGK